MIQGSEFAVKAVAGRIDSPASETRLGGMIRCCVAGCERKTAVRMYYSKGRDTELRYCVDNTLGSKIAIRIEGLGKEANERVPCKPSINLNLQQPKSSNASAT